MAATERTGARAAACGSLVAAALALPGASCAQLGPGPGLVSFKWLDYSDRQPGFDRVGVQSPSVYVAMRKTMMSSFGQSTPPSGTASIRSG